MTTLLLMGCLVMSDIFAIKTDHEPYLGYNGLMCKVVREPPREDGYLECYIPSRDELILLKSSELEELSYDKN